MIEKFANTSSQMEWMEWNGMEWTEWMEPTMKKGLLSFRRHKLALQIATVFATALARA